MLLYVVYKYMKSIKNAIIPFITTGKGSESTSCDIYSHLLEDRIIMLSDEIDSDIASIVVAELLFLASKDPTKPIKMYINSPGGEVTSGLAILDTMNTMPCVVETYCVGMCASMSAVLLSSGTKGHRYSSPHSRIMIHNPNGGAEGDISDVEVQVKEMAKLRDILVDILSKTTKTSKRKLISDMNRDNYMTPEEALRYGIIDRII